MAGASPITHGRHASAWSWRSRVAVAVGGSVAISGAVHLLQPKPQAATPRELIQIPQAVVDGLAGAVGEVAQICVLYPLETIKVRCQADGISAALVMRAMLSKHGAGWALLGQLYSGFSAAAGFSLVVGAVHWLSFCAAKRTALETLPKVQPKQKQREHQKQQHTQQDSGAAAAAAGTVTQSGEVHRQQQALGSSAAQAATASLAVEGQPQDVGSPSSEDAMAQRTSANALAAMVGALCTALVEAPVELFRHQAQAGLISGRLTQEMGQAVRAGGPLALWAGFLPFLLEAFPFDMSELGVYSQLRDVWDTASGPGGRFHGLSQRMPEDAADLAIGGAAGAAAVIISMPFDCIKTYLQTRDMGGQVVGVRAQAAQFLGTGMRMVRGRGLGALYVGMVPRLVQQVPSSTICWWAVQRTGKLLEPFVHKPSPTTPSITTPTLPVTPLVAAAPDTGSTLAYDYSSAAATTASIAMATITGPTRTSTPSAR